MSPRRGTASVAAGSLARAGSVATASLVTARALAPEDFAAFSIVMATTLFVAPIAALGSFDLAIVAGNSGVTPRDALVGLLRATSILMPIAAGGAVLLAAMSTERPDYVALAALSGALSALWIVREPTTGLLLQGGALHLVGLFDGARGLLVLTAAILTHALGGSFRSLCFLTAAGCAALTLGSLVAVYRLPTASARRREYRAPWRTGLILGCSRAVDTGFSAVDQLVLGTRTSALEVGRYALAARATWGSILLPAALIDIARPDLYETRGAPQRQVLHRTILRATVLATASALAVCVAIGVWGDSVFPNYPGLARVAWGLAVVPLARSIAIPSGAVLIGSGRQGRRLRIQSVMLCVYVLALLLVVPFGRVAGAVAATAGVEAVMALWLYSAARSEIGRERL